MLMENTLQFKKKKNLKCIFDLKGSTFGRITNPKKTKITPGTILKDLDLV
jgi:hypothetical protein